MRRTLAAAALGLMLGGLAGSVHTELTSPVPPAPTVRVTEDDPRWQCDTHGDGRCQAPGLPARH